jgi:hypothetical protein
MGARIALLVLNFFAALWAWIGLRLSGVAPSLTLLPFAVSIGLLGWGWRAVAIVPAARGSHIGRVVGLWSAVEVVALLVAANVLEHYHRPDLMVPIGAMIVGLHFFPLARGIPVKLYHATGAGLLVAGVAGLVAPAADRAILAGIGAALVLWGTALIIILRAPQASTATA